MKLILLKNTEQRDSKTEVINHIKEWLKQKEVH